MKLVLSKWFTPDGAPDEFEVLLRGLSVADWETVNELATDKKNPGGVTDHFIECGVLDWRGVERTEGESLDYSPDEFKRLPFKLQEAVVDKIVAMSSLDQDAEKNSPSRSRSGKTARAARITAKPASSTTIATKTARRRNRS